MATIKKKYMGDQQFGGFTPYGNLTTYRATLQAIANGALVNAESAAPLAIGDKVYLEKLPAGLVLEDAQTIVSDAMAAGVTGSLGFEYVDGIDSAEAPQDAAYFGSGINLAAVGRVRATGAKPVVKLAKEAYLVLTIAGAANDQAARLDFVVHGERLGPR